MIPPHVIQQILETARIEEVVGDYVSLKKRGVNLLGLCPFHNEKTPSFTVSPAKNLFKCFGCGKGGNALKFIMEHEKASYVDALRLLAARYNIEIEEQELTPEQKEARDEKESLLAVNAFAVKFFHNTLFQSEQGKEIGLSYLKERGFTQETIKKFELGYSPDEWDAFTGQAVRQGFKMEYLEKTGLSIVKEGKAYDRFRGRVIFPVYSLSGRVIAFGGRILAADPNKAKYVNSPESLVYHKGDSLYGIYQARNAIISKDECLLVEGYTDVISMHQAGFTNTLASSGTSLTTGQIKLIKRFTPNITILYDGDEAGIKASFRGIDLILEEGMNVKIILFPEGDDPDSFLKKHRHSEVEEFLGKEKKNFILFKTSLLLKEAKDDPIRRAQLVREIVQSIAIIPDQIQRNIYIKECSSLMNVPEQTLANELNKLVRRNFEKKNFNLTDTVPALPALSIPAVRQTELDYSETEFQEKDIIRLLLNYCGEEIIIHGLEDETQTSHIRVGDFIIQEIERDEIHFSNPLYQEIFDIYSRAYREGSFPAEKFFIDHPVDEIAQLSVDLLSSPYLLSKNWLEKKKITVLTEKQVLADAVTSSVLSLKLRKIEKMTSDNQRLIQLSIDEEETDSLLQKQHLLNQVKRLFSEKLGRIITR